MCAATSDVLVTGATGEIGAEITRRLSAEGYRVIGLARRAPGSEFPGEFLVCDLADEAETARAVKTVVERYSVDRIVNNAGIAEPQSLDELDMAVAQRVWDVNVRASMQLVQGLVPGMRARGFGRIVNIASRAIYGARDRTAYAAAKSALVGCTRTWALELAPDGITSNAIAPGPIGTELFYRSRPRGSEAEVRALASIPVGRLGTPADVAAATCFLLSDEAGYITGQVLNVDGGGSLGGR